MSDIVRFIQALLFAPLFLGFCIAGAGVCVLVLLWPVWLYIAVGHLTGWYQP